MAPASKLTGRWGEARLPQSRKSECPVGTPEKLLARRQKQRQAQWESRWSPDKPSHRGPSLLGQLSPLTQASTPTGIWHVPIEREALHLAWRVHFKRKNTGRKDRPVSASEKPGLTTRRYTTSTPEGRAAPGLLRQFETKPQEAPEGSLCVRWGVAVR